MFLYFFDFHFPIFIWHYLQIIHSQIATTQRLQPDEKKSHEKTKEQANIDAQRIARSELLPITDADYEDEREFELHQVPLTLELGGKQYQLSAAIVYEPARGGGLGHYKAAVRCKKTWEIFDDTRTAAYSIDDTIELTIQCILYTFCGTC